MSCFAYYGALVGDGGFPIGANHVEVPGRGGVCTLCGACWGWLSSKGRGGGKSPSLPVVAHHGS